MPGMQPCAFMLVVPVLSIGKMLISSALLKDRRELNCSEPIFNTQTPEPGSLDHRSAGSPYLSL